MLEKTQAVVRLASLLALAALGPATSGCRSCSGSSGAQSGGESTPAADDNSKNVRPLREMTKHNLRSVWGSSATDVWVVGDSGTILHFDGKAWSLVRPASPENLTAVRGLGPNEVWAAGDKGSVFHWDGKQWSRIAGEDKITFLTVWASSPEDVWVGGMDGEGDSGYIYRYTGGKWTGQPIPGSTSVWDVYGTSATDVWMVGSSPNGTGVVLHGDGKKFDAVGFKGSGARGVWSSHTNDVWVAPYEGALEHWDGTNWTHQDHIASAGNLLRVSGSAPDDLWAVGLNGTFLRNRGGAWTQVSAGTTEVIWSVWTRAVDDAWAVGNNGMIMRWNGSSWAKQG